MLVRVCFAKAILMAVVVAVVCVQKTVGDFAPAICR
jgi:hypothetical protein